MFLPLILGGDFPVLDINPPFLFLHLLLKSKYSLYLFFLTVICWLFAGLWRALNWIITSVCLPSFPSNKTNHKKGYTGSIFQCKCSHGCSPLVPSIQTDLLCWGVISTGRASPPLLPGFLGPPKGRRLMSTRNFVPDFLQPPPDPPWKTLAPAQRAPVSP